MKDAMLISRSLAGSLLLLAALALPAPRAQASTSCTTSTTSTTVAEDFTGICLNNTWTAINGACLTAGAGSNGSIPSCIGLSYYTNNGDAYQVGGQNGYLGNSTAPAGNASQSPDATGQGALRLTNGSPNYHENGAIISTVPFSSTNGVQITFTTVSYEGDSGGSGGDGADGMSFFLLDATASSQTSYLAAPSQATNHPTGASTSTYAVLEPLGSWGGSLGYTCSNTNTPYVGIVGYMGLGIDEYGNFLNSSDNTASGVAATTYGTGDYQWNRIGLRGQGNVNFDWLNANYPSYYPASLSADQQATAVQKTCETGVIWNFASGSAVAVTSGGASISVNDYQPIPGASAILPAGTQIANEAATTRAQATPIQYQLTITNTGLLSLAYSINGGALTQVLSNQSITSGTQGSLPSELLFGFAGSTGGSDNVHEILCFQASPPDETSASATVNLPQDEYVTNAQLFLPTYHTNNWWGELVAWPISFNSSTNTLTLGNSSGQANWDAACVLTNNSGAGNGPVIPGYTNNCPVSVASAVTESYASRTIFSWNGTSGIPFEWTNLSSAERTALDPGVAASGTSNRLLYLRGDRADEIPTSGAGTAQIYRDRTAVLGDIVHSSPAWVGPPTDTQYETSFSDNLNSGAVAAEPAGSYLSFYTSYYGRENIVYVGANDGLLHGFRAGTYSSGSFNTTNNDGTEVVAYMPSVTVDTIHATGGTYDYSSPNYAHAFSVDGSPRSDDLYYNGAWHTWLAGGLAAGGAAVYALDVTNPSNFVSTETTAEASSFVVGEWNAADLNCTAANPTSFAGTACAAQLNNTYGTPVIWRFHALNSTTSKQNMWGMVFGNGFPNSITASISGGFTGSIGNTITASIGGTVNATISGTTMTVTSVSSGVTLGPGTTVVVPSTGRGGGGGSGGTTTISSDGTGSGGTGTYTLAASFNVNRSTQMSVSGTTMTVTSGSGIVIGAAISGSGVTAGTTIVSQGTGTSGGTGTYTLSTAQYLASSQLSTAGTTLTVTAGSGLAVGQTISWTSPSAGSTTISSFVSGTSGGPGTYTVAAAELVPSQTMSDGVTTLTVTAGAGLAVGQKVYSYLTTTSGSTTTYTPFTATISSMGTGTGGAGTYNLTGGYPVSSQTMYALSASSTGSAGIYVVLMDPGSSAQYVYYLDTGYGPSHDPVGKGRPNGIAYTAAADLDGDNTVDYVYAGDRYGNLWRFDLTSSSAASWTASSFNGGSTPTPLFSSTPTTSAGNTYATPISTKPVVVEMTRADGLPAVIIDFGTGEEYPFTAVSPTSYAGNPQFLFGVWDWNMSAFNSSARTSLAALSTAQGTISFNNSSTTSPLQQQVLTVQSSTVNGYSVETDSMNNVCWDGATAITGCTTYTQYGWYIQLPNSVTIGTSTAYEQVIYNPTYWEGVLEVNTTIPSSSTPFACSLANPTGYTLLINPVTGGSFTSSVFSSTSGSGINVAGMQLNLVGSATNIFIGAGFTGNSSGETFIGGNTANENTNPNQAPFQQVNAPGSSSGHRVTWTELR